jgi:hypothetical protein
MHLDIKAGKIWIQANNTDIDIAEAIVAKVVPKEDFVIGLQPDYLRQYTYGICDRPTIISKIPHNSDRNIITIKSDHPNPHLSYFV